MDRWELLAAVALLAAPLRAAELEAPKLSEAPPAAPTATPTVPSLPALPAPAAAVEVEQAAGRALLAQPAHARHAAPPAALVEAQALAAPKAEPAKPFDGVKPLGAGGLVELGAYALPVALGSAVLGGNLHGSLALAPALAAGWAVYVKAGEQHIGALRSTLVGGWQASHDQKMRHDYGDGRLKDIRGRKYGSDRYDELFPGTPTAAERLGLRAFAASAGAMSLWLAHGDARAFAVYGATAAGLWLTDWLWRRAHPPEPAPEPRPYDR